MQFNPPDGYRNTTSFPTKPSSETVFRDSMQDLLDQIRDFLNGADPFSIYTKKAGDSMSGLLKMDNGLLQIGSDAGDAIQINFAGKIAKGTTGVFGSLSDIWTTENSPSSLATNGYQKLANGLIIQWGFSSILTGGSPTTVTYPIAFTTSTYTIACTVEDTAVSSATVLNIGLSNFGAIHNAGSNKSIRWIAIGR